MKKVTVYCGSNKGKNSIYEEGAKCLATEMISRDMALVYGAGNVGLMGIIADEMLMAGKTVYGIIPQKLVDIEVAHVGCTELTVVETMRDRKWLMAEKGDGFIAMPGGIGTFEELFEIMTLNQLAYITKPLALYNVGGYYDKLLAFLQFAVDEGFLKQAQLDMIIVSDDPVALLDRMNNFQPVYVEKWEDLDFINKKAV
ncbi:LOG family protein [Anditalea andensis]|uniref:Cytokinin riboside 5'-monophosphate phosphoribohydrolase n=1 Tax=Anditalea andensis TaxID=1048983 RepID=A0A074L0H6_9BACT|nr:TIGR00730 family Rossman fold protein [Anditalea andensis]KEO73373.1 lysine decarboxylase [Anditalea andensis]